MFDQSESEWGAQRLEGFMPLVDHQNMWVSSDNTITFVGSFYQSLLPKVKEVKERACPRGILLVALTSKKDENTRSSGSGMPCLSATLGQLTTCFVSQRELGLNGDMPKGFWFEI